MFQGSEWAKGCAPGLEKLLCAARISSELLMVSPARSQASYIYPRVILAVTPRRRIYICLPFPPIIVLKYTQPRGLSPSWTFSPWCFLGRSRNHPASHRAHSSCRPVVAHLSRPLALWHSLLRPVFFLFVMTDPLEDLVTSTREPHYPSSHNRKINTALRGTLSGEMRERARLLADAGRRRLLGGSEARRQDGQD